MAHISGNFETKAQNLGMRPEGATILGKSNIKLRTYATKKTSHSSMGKISLWLIFQEILRPKAQNLGMRPKVCCRPNTTIKRKSIKRCLIFLGK